MSDVSVLFGEEGAAPACVEWGGKAYKAGLLTQARKAAFVRWLRQDAYAALSAKREFLSPEEFKEREAALDARLEAGDFDFFGPAALEAFKRPQAMIVLLAQVFGVPEDEAVRLMAARPKEAGDALTRVIKESFPQGQAPDPNG